MLIYVGDDPDEYRLMKGYLDAIPKDLDESARMDGASSFRIFIEIIMPLSRPILAVVALFSFTGPLGISSSPAPSCVPRINTRCLSVCITRWRKNGCQLHHLRGGAVLIAVPVAILYLALQKYFVSGLTSGSTKG